MGRAAEQREKVLYIRALQTGACPGGQRLGLTPPSGGWRAEGLTRWVLPIFSRPRHSGRPWSSIMARHKVPSSGTHCPFSQMALMKDPKKAKLPQTLTPEVRVEKVGGVSTLVSARDTQLKKIYFKRSCFP